MMHGQINISLFLTSTQLVVGDRCGTVVKVLCYRSEGRWFDLGAGNVCELYECNLKESGGPKGTVVWGAIMSLVL